LLNIHDSAPPLAHRGAAFCLLPRRHGLAGPVTVRRMMRAALVYLAVFLIGLVLMHATNTRVQGFGLGLMAPGAGFLLYAGVPDAFGGWHASLAAASVLVFALSLLLWFATGNVLAPPAVWLGSAAGASLMPQVTVLPAASAMVPVVALWVLLLVAITVLARGALGRRRTREANAYLLTQAHINIVVTADNALSKQELSLLELRHLRFLLDRALQPVENFDGFEWRDQYQTAAVRYQLNFMGYALAMTQATRLPAFDAWLGEAQQRLIDKQTDNRIWCYWHNENRWGNLDCNADPVARDNIMYSGFCAAQMAMYHTASGRRDFVAHGSFRLRDKSAAYDYSLPALIAALDRGFRQSAYTLMACEPNWIYPLCNTIGATAMLAHDRMTGGAQWSQHEARFRQQLESEFVTARGDIVPCRSNYTGLAFPCVGGAQPQALPCFFLHALMPDIAMRQWLLLRRKLYRNVEAEDQLNRAFFWRIDTGNYGLSRAAAYACTALAAAELGDQRVATLCLQALDDKCPALETSGGTGRTGGWYRPDASVWAHAVELMARVNGRNAFRSLITQPRPARGITNTIAIAQARYPDVLCAAANSTGGELHAVFYPGHEAGPQAITLAGLAPYAHYRCTGAQVSGVTADAAGHATVNVMLAGRTVLQVTRKA
jgi:hypothetical protein